MTQVHCYRLYAVNMSDQTETPDDVKEQLRGERIKKSLRQFNEKMRKRNPPTIRRTQAENWMIFHGTFFSRTRGTYVLLLRKSTSTVQGVTAIKPFPPVVLFQYKSLKRN